MQRKKLLKHVFPIFLVIVVLGGTVVLRSNAKPVDPVEDSTSQAAAPSIASLLSRFLSVIGQNPSIMSDGLAYPINMIRSMSLAAQLPKENILPLVENKETLLKLLLERGALYDPSPNDNRVFNSIVPDGALFSPGIVGAPAPSPSAFSADMPLAEAESVKQQIAGGNRDDGGYSETNEQVSGVSEGDIVKTDGEYIYAMAPHSGMIRIVKADGAKLKLASIITTENIWGSEFYLIGSDRLVIVAQEYAPIMALPATTRDDKPDMSGRAAPEIAVPEIAVLDYYVHYSRNFTVLLIYDISDRANPVQLRRVSMDGWNVSTRVIGDIVYLVTNKNIWSIPYAEADSPGILPYCRDSASGNEYEPISFDRMYYIPNSNDCSYMLIGAIDVYSDAPFEPVAYLGAGSNLYMSRNAMYITKWRYSDESTDSPVNWRVWREMTDIMRFAINGTEITYTGMGTVDGAPINQYSMDEHEGYFRIATTEWNTGTYVTVMDTNDMRTVGQTEPLAPGERMQSMRFMGNMGYVVTFENVDPLFTIDLSDPYDPKMLGELKIPGFSQYLHPLGDGLMLGIGRDTQELYTRNAAGVETVVGFRDVGMKISLFDLNDPFDPKEIDVLALGEGWAEVSHNPRALMCDTSRGIYGFMTESWQSGKNFPNSALLLRVENGRLSIAASLTANEYTSMYASRLSFIANTLYFIHENGIIAYDYDSFKRIGNLRY